VKIERISRASSGAGCGKEAMGALMEWRRLLPTSKHRAASRRRSF
jgi:hypothetical protein